MEQHKRVGVKIGGFENEADLLCGDSIINFKTVQSMGHEEKMFEKFKEILTPITKLNKKDHVITGFGFGISNFITYCTFAGLFYFGGMIIENSYDEKTKTYGVNPEHVFLAIFAIFWGA